MTTTLPSPTVSSTTDTTQAGSSLPVPMPTIQEPVSRALPAPDRPSRRGAFIATAALSLVVGAACGFATGRASRSGSVVATSKAAVTTVSKSVPNAIDGKPAPPDTAPVDTLLSYALGRHAAGQTAEASRVYEVILTREPANKFALYNLGQIEQTGGNPDGALARYAKVLTLDANYFPAVYNSALAFEAKDDRPSAINYFRRALAVDANSAPAKFHLGTILVATGKVDEGQALVNAAIATNPELATP